MKKPSLTAEVGDELYTDNQQYILDSGKTTFVAARISKGSVWWTFFDEAGRQHCKVPVDPSNVTVGYGTRPSKPVVLPDMCPDHPWTRALDCDH